MDALEVCHCSWRREVHLSELINQAIHIFPYDSTLFNRKIQKGKELFGISLNEVDFVCLYFYRPSRNLLGTVPVSLFRQGIIYAH